MSRAFDKEVAELAAQGITLNDLLPEEVEGLVFACDRMMHPYSRENLEAAGMPVELADGTRLYRLTIGASCWLDEFAAKWWPTNSKHYFWATVYALINGRSRDAFTGLTDPQKTHDAIIQACKQVTVTEQELIDGIERAVGNAEEGTANEGSGMQIDYASLAGDLELATGMPTDHWMWDVSADWAAKMYHKQRKFAASMQGKSMPRMRDELDAATSRLARLRAAIVKRVTDARETK